MIEYYIGTIAFYAIVIIIAITIIKKIGLEEFIGLGIVFVLLYFLFRVMSSEFGIGYPIGLLVTLLLALVSYRTARDLSEYNWTIKYFVWLLFAIQIATSPYIVLFVIRIFKNIPCYALIGNIAICVNYIILAIASIAAFILIFAIKRISKLKNKTITSQ